MHNKDKVIFDKKLPYEYNICLYILEELCDKEVTDVFEMTESLFPRRVFAKQKDSHFNIIETRAMYDLKRQATLLVCVSQTNKAILEVYLF